MKILMTGFTARMVGSTRIRHKFHFDGSVIKRTLEKFAHKVDQRPVDIGEDLSNYDRIVVGLGVPDSMGACYIFGALWCLSRAPEKCVCYCEDWSIIGFRGHVETTIKHHHKKFKFNKRQIEEAIPHWTEFVATLRALITEPCPIRLLIPITGWGDGERLGEIISAMQPAPYDPTPLLELPRRNQVQRRYDRARSWVLATLQDHETWLKKQRIGHEWPIKFFGNVRHNQKIISVSDVFDEYSRNWGAIAPSYDNEGLGFYRDRYDTATRAGAIVYCGASDARKIGPAFQYDAIELEHGMDAWLDRVAKEQREQVESHVWQEMRAATVIMAAIQNPQGRW